MASAQPTARYDIPASEIEAGMEPHLLCPAKVGKGNNGYKIIEEFMPEAANEAVAPTHSSESGRRKPL